MKCKPTVKNVFDFINSIAPFDAQCEWDNSGMLVGEPERRVSKIGVVLDITPEAVKFAAENGIDLIVSHHPVIFRAAKSFLANEPAYMLARGGISAICAHTSLDKAAGGVNDALASALGFDGALPLTANGEAAMLRTAEIPETDGESLAKYVSERLKTGVRLADCGKKIKKVALCGGSGGDFIADAAAAGCDAYITGDLSHHQFLDGLAEGITLIAAGHFETENPVVAVLAEKLEENFDCDIIQIPQNLPVKYFYNLNEE